MSGGGSCDDRASVYRAPSGQVRAGPRAGHNRSLTHNMLQIRSLGTWTLNAAKWKYDSRDQRRKLAPALIPDLRGCISWTR